MHTSSVCLHTHMCTRTCALLCVYLRACACIHTCPCIFVCSCTHVCAYAYLCACADLRACVYVYVHTYNCPCVCVHVCVLVHTCAHLCVACAYVCVHSPVYIRLPISVCACIHGGVHDSLGVHTCVQLHKPVPWGSADPGVGGIRPPTFRSQLHRPLLTPPDHLQMLTGLPHGLSPPIIASGFLFVGLRGTCGDIRTFILMCSVSPQGLVLFPVGSPVTEQGLALKVRAVHGLPPWP